MAGSKLALSVVSLICLPTGWGLGSYGIQMALEGATFVAPKFGWMKMEPSTEIVDLLDHP